jgi:hypothetical protein
MFPDTCQGFPPEITSTVYVFVYFSQQDLVEDDVMILDVWDAVYIWVGSGANQRNC